MLSPASPLMTEPVNGIVTRMWLLSLGRHPPLISGGRFSRKKRSFQNRLSGSPIRSTLSSSRDPKPIATASWVTPIAPAVATQSQDTPMSRDFSARRRRRPRQPSTTHRTNSRCLGNSRNGTRVGNPTSALRGSNVMPQSSMRSSGWSRYQARTPGNRDGSRRNRSSIVRRRWYSAT